MKFSVPTTHGAYAFFEVCDECKVVVRLADKIAHRQWHEELLKKTDPIHSIMGMRPNGRG